MKWIEEKMKVLGCDRHPDYKLTFYLDSKAMISIHSPKYGVIEVKMLANFCTVKCDLQRKTTWDRSFQVKPLGVIWKKFPQYTKETTIMFDDLRRNFLMNPTNGLKIRPFKNAHASRSTDRELIKLAAYLKRIAALDSFDDLDHKHWESYMKKSD